VNPIRSAALVAAALAVGALAYAGTMRWHRQHLPEKPSITESCRSAVHVRPDDILIIGDSITALPEWHELLDTARVRNRAKSGARTGWLAAQQIPPCRTVILSIGVNDLQGRVPADQTRVHLASIARQLESRRVLLVPPMAPNLAKFRAILLPHHPRIHIVAPDEAADMLARLRAALPLAEIVDVSPLLGADGRLHADMTDDGLHPNGHGYVTLGAILAGMLGAATHADHVANR
jgi:lysophospholipase L1-like esterase